MIFFLNNENEKKNIVYDYKNKNVSDKLVKIVMSFVGFINENNYKKWSEYFYNLFFWQKTLKLMNWII